VNLKATADDEMTGEHTWMDPLSINDDGSMLKHDSRLELALFPRRRVCRRRSVAGGGPTVGTTVEARAKMTPLLSFRAAHD
jgi:hypothetical protein